MNTETLNSWTCAFKSSEKVKWRTTPKTSSVALHTVCTCVSPGYAYSDTFFPLSNTMDDIKVLLCVVKVSKILWRKVQAYIHKCLSTFVWAVSLMIFPSLFSQNSKSNDTTCISILVLFTKRVYFPFGLYHCHQNICVSKGCKAQRLSVSNIRHFTQWVSKVNGFSPTTGLIPLISPVWK